jgi:D-alanyl-D-alanine endopeptidase (penicillin-binding protein 7)
MIKFFIVFFLSISSVFANVPSYYVYNQTEKEIVVGEYAGIQRPIASLTKLMTALVIVNSGLDLQEQVIYRGGIFRSKHVSRKDLLDSLLIKSDNAAAEALANSWPGGRSMFIDEMNNRARLLKMNNTSYSDPSGLDKRNISTAFDLSKLVEEASKYNLITTSSSSKYLTIENKNKKKISYVSVGNTNKNLLFEFDNIILSKTGYTNPAGRCLALLVEKSENKFIIIILGEKTVIDREKRARQLINNYVTIKEKDLNENRFYLLNF